MRHDASMAMSIDAFFALLKAQKHTGAVTIHLAQGTPNRVEIPSEPRRIVLDRRVGDKPNLTT